MKRCMLWSVVLIMLLSLTVVFAQNQQEKEGKLKGKRIVMIIAAGRFDSDEFKDPKDIFEQRGAKIIVASSTLSEETSTGFYTLTVKPDMLINDVKVKDFDAIVFIGGFGVGEYFDNPTAQSIAKQALEQKKILAAIGLAPTILANAGLLNGKKATASSSYHIKQKGAIYTGKPVERDGNIITAIGPSASTQFGEAIASALGE